MLRSVAPLIVLLFFFTSCAGDPPAAAPDYVDFRGRRLDLQPFLSGFPHHYFFASYDAGRLFFLSDEEEKTVLQTIALRRLGRQSHGKTIAAGVDFAGFNAWGMTYNDRDGCFYWAGDDDQHERINLWRLDPRRGRPERLTDVPYVFSWSWNATRDTIAFVARSDSAGAGGLYLLDLQNGRTSLVARDRPQLRFTWGAPAWLSDGRSIVVTALRRGDRRYGNLVQVDPGSGAQFLLTDSTRQRTFPTIVHRRLADGALLYYSDEDGYRNLFTYDSATGRHRQLTSFQQEVGAAALLRIDRKECLLVITAAPGGDHLYLLDPADGRLLREKALTDRLTILDSRGNRLLLTRQSIRKRPEVAELRLSDDGFRFTTLLRAGNRVRAVTTAAAVERISFPTFDTLDGGPRRLPGFLYRPRRPRPLGERMLFLRAFYGGDNTYDAEAQFLASAGCYVFSPAVRGSSGRGRSFAALNDGDLGGDEIRDLLAAARHLSDSLGIPPERVAVFGNSHGGYAALRALTWPPTDSLAFPFGYGISHGGFSNLLSFFHQTNIPGWVLLEAGDPANSSRFRRRSPLWNARNLTGRLLLSHGTEDPRVPIAQSRQLADTLRFYGKKVKLLEFAGQGHAIQGIANQRQWYRAVCELVGTSQ